jgi:hypothetical protein
MVEPLLQMVGYAPDAVAVTPADAGAILELLDASAV